MHQPRHRAAFRRALGIAIAALMASSGPCRATELVYRPMNPSFGGDPANGSVLLNSANAQNSKSDPKAASASAAGAIQTPLQQFTDMLQRSILSRISASVSNGLFNGSGGLMPGNVETTDFRISITDLGGGTLQITTTDKTTGQMTSFQVSQ